MDNVQESKSRDEVEYDIWWMLEGIYKESIKDGMSPIEVGDLLKAYNPNMCAHMVEEMKTPEERVMDRARDEEFRRKIKFWDRYGRLSAVVWLGVLFVLGWGWLGDDFWMWVGGFALFFVGVMVVAIFGEAQPDFLKRGMDSNLMKREDLPSDRDGS